MSDFDIPKRRGAAISYHPYEPIKKLMPRTSGSDARKQRAACAIVVREVVRQAVMTCEPSELLIEVYLAGLWHGAELQRARNLSTDESTPA